MGLSWINALLGIWIVIASSIWMTSGTPKTLMVITGVLVFAVAAASGGFAAKRFVEHRTEHH